MGATYAYGRTYTSDKTNGPMQVPPPSSHSPMFPKDKPTVKSWDFRIGRDKDGKWHLGNGEYDTQEEMLSALQDVLDELFGPEEYDVDEDPYGLFHVAHPLGLG